MVQTLERAIAIAATAHAGQVDKGGAPYILHPLKVMMRMATLEERIVAVLHDVVEDCGVNLDDLRREGFSEEVLTAIASVTKAPGESYDDFVDRAAQNAIGRVVKLADLEENSDLSRIASPSWEDLERVEKYRRAMARLRM
ncbi:HD domain-containing protein [Pseudomonas hamedanensis]|uniref:HD domain-containing protein n=1 Tax=Pseudomonas hamedanensis TaxID=2745504 RepID=A0A9E6THD9_9PSED|nr:HD domain-containing protein [Pseudomonas hamedanensis]QXI18726.1 HD domain-containing protein [Pseudomonas hamedanensis]